MKLVFALLLLFTASLARAQTTAANGTAIPNPTSTAIFKALGVTSRTQAIVAAANYGIRL